VIFACWDNGSSFAADLMRRAMWIETHKEKGEFNDP
jgi:hypothetical protein